MISSDLIATVVNLLIYDNPVATITKFMCSDTSKILDETKFSPVCIHRETPTSFQPSTTMEDPVIDRTVLIATPNPTVPVMKIMCCKHCVPTDRARNQSDMTVINLQLFIVNVCGNKPIRVISSKSEPIPWTQQDFIFAVSDTKRPYLEPTRYFGLRQTGAGITNVVEFVEGIKGEFPPVVGTKAMKKLRTACLWRMYDGVDVFCKYHRDKEYTTYRLKYIPSKENLRYLKMENDFDSGEMVQQMGGIKPDYSVLDITLGKDTSFEHERAETILDARHLNTVKNINMPTKAKKGGMV